MSANVIIYCLSFFLFNTISGQCVGTVLNGGIGGGLENVLPHSSIAHGSPVAPNVLPGFPPSHGGGFAVTSASPIAPNGVTIISDNLIVEGALSVCGQLPVLGTAALEGPLPAAGQGAVEYACGDGEIGIMSETIPPDSSYTYMANPVIDYTQFVTPVSCSYVY